MRRHRRRRCSGAAASARQASERLNAASTRSTARRRRYAKAYALAHAVAASGSPPTRPRRRSRSRVEALEIAEKLELYELRVATLHDDRHRAPLTRATRRPRRPRASIAIAAERAPPRASAATSTSAACSRTLGDLRASLPSSTRRDAAASSEYGDARLDRWFEAERSTELYWRGRWDEALSSPTSSSARRAAGSPASSSSTRSLVRGWIALARGDVDAAVVNADTRSAFARSAADPQNLYPALAFRARARRRGRRRGPGGARSSTSCSSRARDARPSPPSFWVVDLALACDALGRGRGVLDGSSRPACEPAGSTRRTRDRRAATSTRPPTICGEIGALPDEADVRLAAAARDRAAGREPDGDGAVARSRSTERSERPPTCGAAELLVSRCRRTPLFSSVLVARRSRRERRRPRASAGAPGRHRPRT